jgi:HK97 family phage portal protein
MGALTNFIKASFQNSTLTNPEKWVVDFFGGGSQSNSGVRVNEETAMRVTAYLAAVKIISETVGSLPLFVYRKLESGGKERAPNHPLYNVLHDISNSEMTAFQMRETLQGHACSWGNGYAEIERDNGGRVIGLYPLLPDRTFPERDQMTKKITYRTLLPNGEQIKLPFENVFHLPGFGFDGLIGYNPVVLAKEAIGMSMATEEFGARFFGQGANSSGIVEYPKSLSPEALKNFKKDVNIKYEGLGNAHRLMVLEEGLKYHQVTIPPEAAQFLETRKFQIAEIARIFRVPLHMLAEMDKATFSNIEHQAIEFVVHTIRPWLVRWEQQIKLKLLTASERRNGFFAEHLIDGLLRGDYKSRQEGLAIQRQNGIINADEWRSIENQNPQENGQGKTYLVNGNMITQEKAGGLSE